MRVRSKLLLTSDGKPLDRRFHVDVVVPARPSIPVHMAKIDQNGQVDLDFEPPVRARKLILRVIDTEAERIVFRTAATPIAKIPKRLVYDIGVVDAPSPPRPPDSRQVFEVTVVVQDRKMKPIPGVTVRISAAGARRNSLLEQTTDGNGRADIRIPVERVPDALVAEIVGPGGRVRASDGPRAVKEIGRWWAIGVDVDISALEGPAAEDALAPDPVPNPATEEDEPAIMAQDPNTRMKWRIDHADRIREATREAAGKAIQRRRAQRRKGRQWAKGVLGRKPRGPFAQGDRFVPAGSSSDDQQNGLVRDFEGRLNRTAGKMPGLKIPGSLLEGWKPQPGRKIPDGLLAELLKPLGGQRGFMPKVFADVLQDCQASVAAEQKTSGQDGGEAADDGADVDPAEPALLAPRTMEQRIDAILDAALGTEATRPTTADISSSLTVELPVGPADTDAYYDYHTLDVAWAEAWTAVVDRKMEDRISELYDLVVEVVDPDIIDVDLSEIDELHDMLDTLAEAVGAASASIIGTGTNAPEGIRGWLPDIAAVWDWLTDTEQDYVTVQYAIDRFLKDEAKVAWHALDWLDGPRVGRFQGYPDDWVPHKKVGKLAFPGDKYRRKAESYVDLDAAEGRKDTTTNKPETYETNAATRLGRATRLIGEVKSAIAEPYQFDVFAPGSYNFGSLVTWRQRWRPLNYQVGDLVGSIPLAPNEKRSYKITRKSRSKSRREENRDRMTRREEERTQTERAESEITGKVRRKMTVAGEAGGGIDMKLYKVSAASKFSGEQSNATDRVKKAIRDSTSTAVQEYRDENKLKVELETEVEATYTESRELSNPNNELTVTYLFYELQRRFEVNERLYDLQPVILVAYDVPAPSEISEAWILQNDWIIEEHLLDRSFTDALIYLRRTFAGDELAVEVLEQQWRTQLAIVAGLRHQGEAHQRLRDAARAAVKTATTVVGLSEAGEALAEALAPNTVGGSLGKRIFSAGHETAEAAAENARSSLDWAEQDLSRIEATAREAMTALERATEVYVAALEDRMNRRVQIDRLILHIKQNIMHYMQSIWRAEHPDQRYLRLYDMDIQWPGQTAATVVDQVTETVPGPMDSVNWPPFFPRPKGVGDVQITLDVPRFEENRKLYQVADLQQPLGFQGNLAIFPLLEHNALSTYMAQGFFDAYSGLRDPSPLADAPTATEAVDIAECALVSGRLNEPGRRKLVEWLMDALKSAHKISHEVVTPTGEMFIEALPGAHPLLEDYKLSHRAFDAAQAATNVRASQIDLVRRAMRLTEGDTSDPEVDRFIKVEGGQIGLNLDDGE